MAKNKNNKTTETVNAPTSADATPAPSVDRSEMLLGLSGTALNMAVERYTNACHTIIDSVRERGGEGNLGVKYEDVESDVVRAGFADANTAPGLVRSFIREGEKAGCCHIARGLGGGIKLGKGPEISPADQAKREEIRTLKNENLELKRQLEKLLGQPTSAESLLNNK